MTPKAREFVEGIGAYDRCWPIRRSRKRCGVTRSGRTATRSCDAYGCPLKGYGDLAFVQHMLASLKDDGMLALGVPYGVLFLGGAGGRIGEAMLAADVLRRWWALPTTCSTERAPLPSC